METNGGGHSFRPVDRRHPYFPCYEYVLRGADETAFDYGQRMAQELEDEILRLGPETVMAFMAEPVVGATLARCPQLRGIISGSATSVIAMAFC